MEVRNVSPSREGERGSDLFYYNSPILIRVAVKALEGWEERQGLDLRKWIDIYGRRKNNR